MLMSSPPQRATARAASIISVLAPTAFAALALVASGAALAAGCTGAGAPAATSPIICLTAIANPGNPMTSFDIGWFNASRSEYYLADRSNAGVDVISTATNPPTFLRTIGGFVGPVQTTATQKTNNTLNNAKSGPDGVVAFGRWLYGGDGDSTLKVIDLQAAGTPADPSIKQTISTGGTTRVDEMAISGVLGSGQFAGQQLLIAANNAEDPPFATVFLANANNTASNVTIVSKITVDASIIPPGLGLSMEQPAWDPSTKRFYIGVPQINYPDGCTPSSSEENPEGTVPCQGGLLVIDPNGISKPTTNYGPFDSSVNAGMLALRNCGPNGVAVGPPNDGLGNNLLLGCTPNNMPSNTGTWVVNSTTKNFIDVGGITGSDEVWYNPGDNRYFTASSANRRDINGPPSLGIINAATNLLIGTIPQGSGSHSVAADSVHNFIFVPQVVPKNLSGPPGAGGGDTTGVSAGICGSNNGCIAVYFDQNPAVD